MSNSIYSYNNFFQPIILRSFSGDEEGLKTYLLEYLGISAKSLSFNFIKPLEKTTSISIDQIRSLIENINKSDIEEKIRIYILEDVQNMGVVGQNALLKLLEEPFENILIVLAVRDLKSILLTIKSRCQIKQLAKISISDDVTELSLIKSLYKDTEKNEIAILSNNFTPNMLELQCLSGKLSKNIDVKKINRLKLFKMWIN
jgi:hypothetical protein